jgi:hypothetical protein
MNENLFTTLKQITTQYGMLVLNDTKRLNGFLSDLAHKEPKSEKKALVTCLMNGFHTELQNTTEDRQLCKNRLAQKLHGEEGLDLALCNNTLDLIEAVLFENVTPTVQPVIQPEPTLQAAPSALAPPPVLSKAGLFSFVLGSLTFIAGLPSIIYMIVDGWFSFVMGDFLIGVVPLGLSSLLSLFFGIRAIHGKNSKFRLAGIRISIIDIALLFVGSIIGFIVGY